MIPRLIPHKDTKPSGEVKERAKRFLIPAPEHRISITSKLKVRVFYNKSISQLELLIGPLNF
ncbi:MAG: hypothetical protein KAI96_02800 [Thermodesulfovibrionia bacterium]|nr:hypothetical protein [Thermodesulfovibrionia bacterium]MCK5511706.1 hypothetical protein [Thermodesulfovibrionia bacterium]